MTVGRWGLWVVKREPVLELCGRCVYWVLRALKALEWEDLCGYEDTPVVSEFVIGFQYSMA